MNLKSILKILFLVITFVASSQDISRSSISIPTTLSENANAVIRSNDVQIDLKSSKDMSVTIKRVITILNKEGDDAVDAYVFYDNGVKIKELEVIVYNSVGNQIKKIKKNDFKDVSAVSGGTLYSDSRVKYLDYTPVNYPYTLEYSCVTSTSNTAFIQSFMPINDYFLSIEKSTYQINFPIDLTIRTKQKNFKDFDLKAEKRDGVFKYQVENIQAINPEQYGPEFFNILPMVLITSNEFTLEGVRSEVENWNEFGKWMYHDLIKQTHDLSENTIAMIKDLVKDEPNNIAKAKKIYQYVQDKVRYISVQVGIGGWKPFNASEVDDLGYGDCKALTNYTMALLKAVGVESHYTVVYAGDSQRSFETDFAAMQGNHVILNIPTAHDDIWLECTSQKLPFGFIGDFTDDRDVLVITSEGGEIKHTKKYKVEESVQTITGRYTISNTGSINASVIVSSKGIQYDDKYWLETQTKRDLDEYYKKRWSYINALSINNINIDNNKNEIEFIETINFEANNYAKKVGDRMLLTVNALNRSMHVPDKYRDRKLPVKIKRSFKDVDEFEVKLPSGYKVESLPKDEIVETKFGKYKMKVVEKNDSTLLYNREFIINDGEFPKEDYNGFRNFYKEVSKFDNLKIILIKK